EEELRLTRRPVFDAGPGIDEQWLTYADLSACRDSAVSGASRWRSEAVRAVEVSTSPGRVSRVRGLRDVRRQSCLPRTARSQSALVEHAPHEPDAGEVWAGILNLPL